MKGKEIRFFATKADIEPVLIFVDSEVKMQVCLAGMFDNQIPITYAKLLDIPDYGYTFRGDWNTGNRYLLIPSGIPVNVREVPQVKGGIKFVIDPLVNLTSATRTLGGVFQTKPNIIVCGKMFESSGTEFGITVFKLFAKAIKKQFTLIDDSYVGDEARKKLHLGWRLVIDEKFPTGMELRPDQDKKWQNATH